MINIEIKSKRKTIVGKLFAPPPVKQTQQQHPGHIVSLMTEARRRDDIIKKLAADIKYKEGDVVKPYSNSGIEEYGDDVLVLKICDTYGKFGKNEDWPKDDTPMIVHAKSQKKNISFFCTPHYLVPLNG